MAATDSMLTDLQSPAAEVEPPPGPVGAGWSWRPTPAYHGFSRGYVYPGRQILDVPGRTWPAGRPEDCTSTDPGEWVCDDVLVCTGCGLDCT